MSLAADATWNKVEEEVAKEEVVKEEKVAFNPLNATHLTALGYALFGGPKDEYAKTRHIHDAARSTALEVHEVFDCTLPATLKTAVITEIAEARKKQTEQMLLRHHHKYVD